MNENLKPISELPPFLKFCYTVGMLPTSYRISMTYEEQVLEAIRFIKEEIIPIVNSNALATKELQEKFIELVNYVETYLDNLDVQDEVNNKLNQMASDGTLAEIINQELLQQINEKINDIDNTLTETSKICFISNKTISAEQNSFVGDCSLIIGAKNILIDVGNQTNCEALINYLQENNINKLDYIIISHYHDDHIGGTQAEGLLTLLTQSFIDFSSCKVILPHKNINYSQFIPLSSDNVFRTREQLIIQMLNTNNIQYEFATEGQEIEMSQNEKLTFYNCDTNYYNDYYNYVLNAFGDNVGYTNYNNFSLITKYEHFDNVVFFTGDIEKLAQSKNYQHFKNCDILKVEHHGLNWESNYNYLNQLNPKYAVVCNSQYYETPFDYAHPTVFQVTSKGAKLFTTRTAGKTIEFTSKYNKIYANVDSKNELHNMQYNLWSGQEILPNDDLNDEKYMKPGIYFSRNASVSNSLLNAPKFLSNGGIGAGFKMIVEATTSNQKYIRQTIITSNNNTNRIFYRNSFEGGWTDTEWGGITPSNLGSLNSEELEPYWVAQHTNYNNRLVKRNSIVSLSLNCKIDEQLAERSILLKIPFNILKTGGASYYFLAFANGITQPITLYTNRNDNEKVTEIKNYDAIPANTPIRAFVTIVEEK